MKEEIRIKVFTEDMNDELPTKPDEFLAFWAEKLALVPDEFKSTGKIEVEGGGTWEGCADLNVTISYTRVETDAEEQAREDRERRQLYFRKEQELRQLRKLQAKHPSEA